MQNTTCRWGILGTGNIANRFAHDLALVPDAEIAAVGSRAMSSADRFGDEYNVPRRYGSYDDLASDTDLDIIYIATPHPMHKDNTLMCLDNGKAVLCEKPVAMTSTEAEEMVAAARAKKLFLMEGLWMLFFPAVRKAKELVDSGRIGDVRLIQADFGFCAPWDPDSRVLRPDLGGGALLDVGIYTVALAHLIFRQEPEHVAAVAHIGETGVDEQVGMTLEYGQGRLAALNCAIRTNTTTEAWIYGTEGYVRIPRKFFKPEKVVVGVLDGDEEEFSTDLDGYGFTYEIRDVMQCLRNGRTESDIMPLNTSLAIMRTLDTIRGQWQRT